MIRKIESKMKDRKGFTLIELMIVIAILGVLAAVAIPFYNQYIENSKMRITRSNYETAVRTVKTEFANVTAGNPPADDLLAILNDDDDAGNCRNKNPFTPSACAFVDGAAVNRGEVGLSRIDFTDIATGDDVTVSAVITAAAVGVGPDAEQTLTFQ